MAKKKQEEEQKESVIAVIKELAKERGTEEDVLIKAIEEGIVAAFRREFSSSRNVDHVFAESNRETGEIFVYKLVEVVEEVLDPDNEISLTDAKAMDDEIELGDEVEVGIDVDELGRLAAVAAKSAISQKVREAEYQRIQQDFSGKINERQDEVDVALLCPHLEYQLRQNLDKLRIPCFVLPMKLYGALPVDHLIEEAEDVLELWNGGMKNPILFPDEPRSMTAPRAVSHRRWAAAQQ
jgi:cellobiose-specific phosphotransferase system component IIB